MSDINHCLCCTTYSTDPPYCRAITTLYDDEGASQCSWSGHINWTAGGIYCKGLSFFFLHAVKKYPPRCVSCGGFSLKIGFLMLL